MLLVFCEVAERRNGRPNKLQQLSATIVLSTILHRCSTSRTCTLVAVRYYSISELAPYWKKKKKNC